MLLGPTMNAKVAFELSERVPHLGLRMKEHSNRAMVYAARMKKMGLKVIYPGLEDHPQHQLLKSLANRDYGFGGLLSLDMVTEDRANRLMNQLQNATQFGFMAVSLGYYETLMSCSGSSTSSEMNEEEKKLLGSSNRGSWRHIVYKVRSRIRKVIPRSDKVGLPQTCRYDSYNYARNFDDSK